MRRKGGQSLVKNEERILIGALELKTQDTPRFHGYLLNKHLVTSHSRGLVMSTLYRSLARLTERGLLKSDWELPANSEQWRRVYELTGEGVQVAAGLTESTSRTDSRVGLNPGQV